MVTQYSIFTTMARLARSCLLLVLALCLTTASARGTPRPKAVLPPKSKTLGKQLPVESDKASIPASVFNLINNVAGAGILTLSAGMAGGTGWIPAISICAILGAISAHTFTIIGAACELTGEGDFKVCALPKKNSTSLIKTTISPLTHSFFL